MAQSLKSSPKKSPKAKSKAVIGKPKHRSFRLTPKTGLLSLAFLAVFSTVGLLGYNKVVNGSYTASAYNWSSFTYANNTSVRVRVCKQRALNGSHRFLYYVQNGSGYNQSLRHELYNGKGLGSYFTVYAKSNSAVKYTSYVSGVTAFQINFSGGTNGLYFNYIVNC